MAVNLNDKYYTPDWLVKHTIKKAIEIIGKENITEVVEPSAGDGAFIEQLKLSFNGITYRFYDLYPEHPEVIEQDYKKVRLSYKKGRLTIGNPPFGTSSCLWKAFCKKAATNSDYIAFISPASQYNSNYYFKEGVLVYSELLNNVEYRGSEKENGKNQKVKTCLNIYKVYDIEEEEDWRLNKINSIVKYGRLVREYGEIGYDYYLANGSIGPNNCHLINKGEYVYSYGIKVIDEKYRYKIEEFLNQFHLYNEELKMLKSSFPVIDNAFFTNKLKTFLFPTRKERLDQDILIEYAQKGKMTNYQYFLERKMSCAGELHKNEEKYYKYWYNMFVINIINKEKEQQIVDILKSIRGKVLDYNNSDFAGARNSININVLKDYLIKHLYPEDLYEDYPEIKKPIHIERALYAKELF